MNIDQGILKKSFIALSGVIGFSALKKLANNKIYALTYHSIIGADNEAAVYRTAEEFEHDLRFIKKYFTVINGSELIQLIKSGTQIPENALLITFDDGLRVNYDVQIPILKKYDLPATFFLNSSFIDNQNLHFERKAKLILQNLDSSKITLVETFLRDNGLFTSDASNSITLISYAHRHQLDEIARLIQLDFKEYLAQSGPYLTTDEVKSILKNGFSIGAHSMDHPKYEELSLSEQLNQTIGSINEIKNRFNLTYRLFAFPYGDLTITNEFYARVERHVDLVFGTRGFIDDPIKFSIQRSEVESTQLPIDVALNYRLLTSYLSKVSGIRKIKRL